MRLLCLSNFYPPAGRGGYEQWCQEVSEGLHRRGHEVIVLTSIHGRDAVRECGLVRVCRDLYLEMELASLRNSVRFFTSRNARENANLVRLHQLIECFSPDAVLVWGMWNLTRSLPALAEQLMPGRVIYYMGDYWPTLPPQTEVYWQVPARNWMTAVPKVLLKPLAQNVLRSEQRPTLDFGHVLFPTAFLRDELKSKGISPKNSTIVCGAIDTQLYRHINGSSDTRPNRVSSLLYVGRLTPEKGVHTAIEAFSSLICQQDHEDLVLTIVGSGEPDYERYLRQLANEKQVESAITFLAVQPKESMPALYHQADIFLFTSIWPEPFGRVLVEAMAAGVAVVGTATGGAAEILADNENALVYTPGDSHGLASRIAQLIESPDLRKRLAESGRCTAVQKFDICRMTAEIEAVLGTIVQEPA
jgi:glycogen synthase